MFLIKIIGILYCITCFVILIRFIYFEVKFGWKYLIILILPIHIVSQWFILLFSAPKDLKNNVVKNKFIKVYLFIIFGYWKYILNNIDSLTKWIKEVSSICKLPSLITNITISHEDILNKNK